MQNATAKVNLLDLNQQGLTDFFVALGEKPFRATQIMKWIYHDDVTDFQQMTNISKALREKLSEIAEISLPTCTSEQPSADGTRKWLLGLQDGNQIETVFIPEKNRGTLCVSSQVGCSLNCTFCSTATQGFNRNLSTGDIVAQILFANQRLAAENPITPRAVTNVVMMGMGEPLLNFENVMTAMDIMNDDLAFGISRRRITLSTSGVVPMMIKMRDHCDVSLAVSLHAPDDELRNELVPINKKYPIEMLLDACKKYVAGKARRKITFEYIMIDGVNDTPRHAKKLARLLEGVPSKINLIPFNPFPQSDYRRSSPQAIQAFQDILTAAGYVTITRKTRGDDIDAACGQLVGKVQDRTRRQEKMRQQRINVTELTG